MLRDENKAATQHVSPHLKPFVCLFVAEESDCEFGATDQVMGQAAGRQKGYTYVTVKGDRKIRVSDSRPFTFLVCKLV